ncbi:MAG: M23 family metallopeptidase [Verrucomicrobiota bacterium]|nr:M23 family metallopeptidase [Verrucomicrobiota bacterium]
MKRAFLLSALSMIALPVHGQNLELALPTDNDALYRGDGADFYQHIERDFHGEKSTPWEGGRYGFVRDPVSTSEGLIYTRFHEGIDIKPIQRDIHGEPLDDIRAIADGKVVHANTVAGYSNYGKYIVIEHIFGGCPYYSLYGHLSEIAVTVGQRVSRGERIARMGHTGAGINRERAHVHLELNLLLSSEFEGWHNRTFSDPNHNGIYNGINLAGLDIARLLLELRKRPDLTIPQFLGEEETFYKVAVPDSSHFELRKRYPWMVSGSANARSWEISFARSGVPLKIEGRAEAVSGPTLTYVKKSGVDCSYLTRGTLTGRGANVRLSKSGLDLMKLLTFPD